MDARLAKVRQRKLKKLQEEGSGPTNEEGAAAINLTDFDFSEKDADQKTGEEKEKLLLCILQWQLK